jgi:tetratricopeptide (TPR) repeat protein
LRVIQRVAPRSPAGPRTAERKRIDNESTTNRLHQPHAIRAAHRSALGLGDPRLATYGLFTAGWIHTATGQWAVAIEECREGVRRAPDRVRAAYSSAFLGYALLEAGSLDEAAPVLEQAVNHMQQFRFPQFEALFTALTARAYLARVAAQAAASLAQAALATATASGYCYAVGLAERTLGEIARADGAFAEAAARFEEARTLFTAMGSGFEVARTDLALADLQRSRP